MSWKFVALRHLYGRDHLDQVLATFGLILFFNELVRVIWGPASVYMNVPSWLSGTVDLFGLPYPSYRFAIIAVGLAVGGGLYAVIHRTRVFGRWFAYVGFVAAAATALAPLALLDYNPDDLFQLATFLALVAGDFWFLLIGISLVRRREEPVAPRATGPVA